jgi:AmmeMemoRadiSam system protein B
MAHAYRSINPEKVSRVFLLGPSHHFHSKACLLTTASTFQTPLGPLEVDEEICSALRDTGQFEDVGLDDDEAEHSLELHTPYIARVMAGRAFKLVPIMVGALSLEGESRYGQVLAPYLEDPSNLFIISSDFCHWGTRFNYTFYDSSQGPIWKSVQWLDELGMKAIEMGTASAFAEYLSKYKNTICGRHPIGVLLNMLEACHQKHVVKFTYYDQSSKCLTSSDSSVSYASAVVTTA